MNWFVKKKKLEFIQIWTSFSAIKNMPESVRREWPLCLGIIWIKILQIFFGLDFLFFCWNVWRFVQMKYFVLRKNIVLLKYSSWIRYLIAIDVDLNFISFNPVSSSIQFGRMTKLKTEETKVLHWNSSLCIQQGWKASMWYL